MVSTDKYDRQVRLWGPHGQRALGESRILLFGTSSAGTETLKNLVLPGAGHFHIVDDRVIDKSDCGNDFFVTYEHIGQSKAKVTCELLGELNPDDSQGSFSNMSIEDYVANHADDIQKANMVIVCDVNETLAKKISQLVGPKNIPMILLRQYGMLGYMRSFKAESFLVEVKEA
jgi:amyloid beta precursor protein binding protein 1